ncbi:hypothetical protein [Nocardia sp. NPDC050175]|uniref:hypothetical protein n=1 Tax=Nocardia sp. NPDC050175 TaxID=3364317 RepID=UPI0037A62E97
MTTNTIPAGSFDTLHTQLLVLDPDLEPLFAEVEEILQKRGDALIRTVALHSADGDAVTPCLGRGREQR